MLIGPLFGPAVTASDMTAAAVDSEDATVLPSLDLYPLSPEVE